MFSKGRCKDGGLPIISWTFWRGCFDCLFFLLRVLLFFCFLFSYLAFWAPLFYCNSSLDWHVRAMHFGAERIRKHSQKKEIVSFHTRSCCLDCATLTLISHRLGSSSLSTEFEAFASLHFTSLLTSSRPHASACDSLAQIRIGLRLPVSEHGTSM